MTISNQSTSYGARRPVTGTPGRQNKISAGSGRLNRSTAVRRQQPPYTTLSRPERDAFIARLAPSSLPHNGQRSNSRSSAASQRAKRPTAVSNARRTYTCSDQTTSAVMRSSLTHNGQRSYSRTSAASQRAKRSTAASNGRRTSTLSDQTTSTVMRSSLTPTRSSAASQRAKRPTAVSNARLLKQRDRSSDTRRTYTRSDRTNSADTQHFLPRIGHGSRSSAASAASHPFRKQVHWSPEQIPVSSAGPSSLLTRATSAMSRASSSSAHASFDKSKFFARLAKANKDIKSPLSEDSIKELKDVISHLQSASPQSPSQIRPKHQDLFHNLQKAYAAAASSLGKPLHINQIAMVWLTLTAQLDPKNHKSLMNVQMDTAQGKTLCFAVIAAIKAMMGQKVVVITTHLPLAQQGFKSVESLFKTLQIPASFNSDYHQSMINYTTFTELAFEQLRSLDSKQDVFDIRQFDALIDECDEIYSSDIYQCAYSSEKRKDSDSLINIIEQIHAERSPTFSPQIKSAIRRYLSAACGISDWETVNAYIKSLEHQAKQVFSGAFVENRDYYIQESAPQVLIECMNRHAQPVQDRDDLEQLLKEFRDCEWYQAINPSSSPETVSQVTEKFVCEMNQFGFPYTKETLQSAYGELEGKLKDLNDRELENSLGFDLIPMKPDGRYSEGTYMSGITHGLLLCQYGITPKAPSLRGVTVPYVEMAKQFNSMIGISATAFSDPTDSSCIEAGSQQVMQKLLSPRTTNIVIPPREVSDIKTTHKQCSNPDQAVISAIEKEKEKHKRSTRPILVATDTLERAKALHSQLKGSFLYQGTLHNDADAKLVEEGLLRPNVIVGTLSQIGRGTDWQVNHAQGGLGFYAGEMALSPHQLKQLEGRFSIPRNAQQTPGTLKTYYCHDLSDSAQLDAKTKNYNDLFHIYKRTLLANLILPFSRMTNPLSVQIIVEASKADFYTLFDQLLDQTLDSDTVTQHLSAIFRTDLDDENHETVTKLLDNFQESIQALQSSFKDNTHRSSDNSELACVISADRHAHARHKYREFGGHPYEREVPHRRAGRRSAAPPWSGYASQRTGVDTHRTVERRLDHPPTHSVHPGRYEVHPQRPIAKSCPAHQHGSDMINRQFQRMIDNLKIPFQTITNIQEVKSYSNKLAPGVYQFEGKNAQIISQRLEDSCILKRVTAGNHTHRECTYEEALIEILATCQANPDDVLAVYRTDSEELYMVLKEKNKLPNIHLSSQVKTLLASMADLHAKNIVHGDIKSENIMQDPTTGKVQFIDFGASSLQLNGRHYAGYTRSSLTGPEPSRKDEMAPRKEADIYALGLSIYELVTGTQFPFFFDCEKQHPSELTAQFIQTHFGDIRYRPTPEEFHAALVNDISRRPVSNYLEKAAQEFCFACLRQRPEKRPNASTCVKLWDKLIQNPDLDGRAVCEQLAESERKQGYLNPCLNTTAGYLSDGSDASEGSSVFSTPSSPDFAAGHLDHRPAFRSTRPLPAFPSAPSLPPCSMPRQPAALRRRKIDSGYSYPPVVRFPRRPVPKTPSRWSTYTGTHPFPTHEQVVSYPGSGHSFSSHTGLPLPHIQDISPYTAPKRLVTAARSRRAYIQRQFA
ncbi:MAG: protein kinase [bacterium]